MNSFVKKLQEIEVIDVKAAPATPTSLEPCDSCNFIYVTATGKAGTYPNLINKINDALLSAGVDPSVDICENLIQCNAFKDMQAAVEANTQSITDLNVILGEDENSGLQGRIKDLEDLLSGFSNEPGNTVSEKIAGLKDTLGTLDPEKGTISDRLDALEENSGGCGFIPEITITIPGNTYTTTPTTCPVEPVEQDLFFNL